MTVLLIALLALYPVPFQRCPHGWHRVESRGHYACIRNGQHGPKRPIYLDQEHRG
jgi:hypothetical protein